MCVRKPLPSVHWTLLTQPSTNKCRWGGRRDVLFSIPPTPKDGRFLKRGFGFGPFRQFFQRYQQKKNPWDQRCRKKNWRFIISSAIFGGGGGGAGGVQIKNGMSHTAWKWITNSLFSAVIPTLLVWLGVLRFDVLPRFLLVFINSPDLFWNSGNWEQNCLFLDLNGRQHLNGPDY